MRQRSRLLLLAICLLLSVPVRAARAQIVDGEWSEPYRLSSPDGLASEAECLADAYGYAHCLWTELLFASGRTVIQYARFDGAAWSLPNAVYVSVREVENISPALDAQGTLHLAWSEGYAGPMYYASVPAAHAVLAQDWSRPVRADLPAGVVRLRVDGQGTLHVVYINRGVELGVFYARSDDRGATWSRPVWLDPDIPLDHTPDSLNFELDDAGGLHAAWYYGTLTNTARPDWVRYAHSLDGGHTWSAPFTIDRQVEGSGRSLAFAVPIMAVQGPNVHVIWAAGTLPYRNHRYSTDRGLTWSEPRHIFGELHGQAFDGLAVDAAGHVHFLGQIRYPVAIYHAMWDQAGWSAPALVYRISPDNSETIPADRVHAHTLRPVVRAGNQLILTFTDGPADPNRRLFAVYRQLEDSPALEPLPTPVRTAPPSTIAGPTAVAPEATAALTPTPAEIYPDTPTRRGSSPALLLQAALVPPLLLLGGTLLVRLLTRLKR